MMEKTEQFLQDFFHSQKFVLTPLPESGSERKNFLVKTNSKTYILTTNKRISENETFFYLTNVFSKLHLPVPHIFQISENRDAYLQEYLGEHTLSQMIEKEGHSQKIKDLAFKVIENLSHFQKATTNKVDFTKAYEYETYDHLAIVHDLYYFKNFFADILEIDYPKAKILKEFSKIAMEIEGLTPQVVMIRDFQARNIMVNDREEVFFIDYQGAMLGPATYDLVSFVFQAKANFPKAWKEELLRKYFNLNKDYFSDESFSRSIKYCQLVRYLQVLGAYGFRGLIQKKEHFIKSIPQGIINLELLAESWSEMQKYPALQGIIAQLHSYYSNFTTTST